jgi:hypothetical protein
MSAMTPIWYRKISWGITCGNAIVIKLLELFFSMFTFGHQRWIKMGWWSKCPHHILVMAWNHQPDKAWWNYQINLELCPAKPLSSAAPCQDWGHRIPCYPRSFSPWWGLCMRCAQQHFRRPGAGNCFLGNGWCFQRILECYLATTSLLKNMLQR